VNLDFSLAVDRRDILDDDGITVSGGAVHWDTVGVH
jgi:hypothetical protein